MPTKALQTHTQYSIQVVAKSSVFFLLCLQRTACLHVLTVYLTTDNSSSNIQLLVESGTSLSSNQTAFSTNEIVYRI